MAIGKCPKCNQECEIIKDADFEENGIINYFPLNNIITQRVKKYKIPFVCSKCGTFDFPYIAQQSRVFLWPDPVEKIGSLIIPDKIQFAMINDYGTVLSVGKGYFNRTQHRYIPTELKTGDRVIYDKNIPWSIEVEAQDGKKYEVKLMPEADIKCLVVED